MHFAEGPENYGAGPDYKGVALRNLGCDEGILYLDCGGYSHMKKGSLETMWWGPLYSTRFSPSGSTLLPSLLLDTFEPGE